MSARRRFLRLEERCSGAEIPLMMCRVVEDPLLPLQSYRPRDSRPEQEGGCSTRDIIPDIVPAPRRSLHPRMASSIEKGGSIGTGLWSLFETELSKSIISQQEIEAIEVQTYSLKNPASFFEELMEDDSYARGVAELMSESKKGVLYLVTGFMTARGMTSRQADMTRTRVYGQLTLPVSAAFAPGLSFIDPCSKGSWDVSNVNGSESFAPDEEIFAVSYATIKRPRTFLGLSKKEATLKPRFIGPRFATRTEAAFASGEPDEQDDLIAGLIVEDVVSAEIMSKTESTDLADGGRPLVWVSDQ